MPELAAAPHVVGGSPMDASTPSDNRSNFTTLIHWFLAHKLALAGTIVICFFVLFSFVGPLVYHTNQVSANLNEVNLPPSSHHPLGTDNVGYDVLGRLMAGGQSSLEVGLAAALL